MDPSSEETQEAKQVLEKLEKIKLELSQTSVDVAVEVTEALQKVNERLIEVVVGGYFQWKRFALNRGVGGVS